MEIAKLRINKQDYIFELQNSTAGDYISCKTPENCFGYPDTVLFNHPSWDGYYGCYTLYRHLQPWIMRKIESKMIKLMNKHGIPTGITETSKSFNEKD